MWKSQLLLSALIPLNYTKAPESLYERMDNVFFFLLIVNFSLAETHLETFNGNYGSFLQSFV